MKVVCEPDDWPTEDGQQPCVWVYLPLPQPLPLPEGYVSVQEALPEETYLHAALTTFRYQAVVWQQPRPHNPLADTMRDLVAVISRSLGTPPPDVVPETPVPDDLAAVLTVLEVGVPASPEAPAGDVDAAVDIAIDAARNLQSVVSTVTGNALRLVSKAVLPPFLQIVTGHLAETDDGVREERDGTPLLHPVRGGAAPLHFGIPSEIVGDDALETLSVAADVLGRGTPYAGYADLRRELSVQLHQDGNDRIAVVVAATAAEVLLDTTLLHMLWQEHCDPADAARVFDRSIGHQARVARHLSPRAGGDWNPNGDGPVGTYFAQVANLRNRVVHTGFVPTRSEAEEAQSALQDLERFVGDRLAHSSVRNRYPRTALSLLGQPGLERRNAFTRRLRDLGDNPDEPDWIEGFKRYRVHVDLCSREEPVTAGMDPEALDLYVELPVERYVVHDRAVLMAAVVPDGREWLTAEQSAVVREMSAAVPPGNFARGKMFLEDGRVAPELDWQPEHVLFPELLMWPGTRTTPPG